MTIATDPGEIVRARVAVVSADATLVDRSRAAEMHGVGAMFLPFSVLANVPSGGERCDAIVLFADGFEEHLLESQLQELRCDAGDPVLVVVTNHPQRWASIAERNGTAVVHDTSWRWGILTAILRDGPGDDSASRPKLPFTDCLARKPKRGGDL